MGKIITAIRLLTINYSLLSGIVNSDFHVSNGIKNNILLQPRIKHKTHTEKPLIKPTLTESIDCLAMPCMILNAL